MGRALTPPAVMAERRGADPEVGARVRMKATGRTGTIREVVETRGRTLYYIVHDHASREEAVPLPGEPGSEFGIYAAADTFEVLP
jgi:hypothetical protein